MSPAPMEYEALEVSLGDLQRLVISTDPKDQIAAAVELQALAAQGRISSLGVPEVSALLRQLCSGDDGEVLNEVVALLVPLVQIPNELGILAIREIYNLALRGAVTDAETIAEAYGAISEAAADGSEAAIGVFVESAKGGTDKVRLLAVGGLEVPAIEGHAVALSTLLAAMADEMPDVADAALVGLGAVVTAAERGSADAFAALAGQSSALRMVIQRENCDEAVAALGAAAGGGDADAMEVLLQLAGSYAEQEALSHSAVRALGIATMECGKQVPRAKAFEALMAVANGDEGEEDLRVQAVRSLAVAHGRDSDVVAALSALTSCKTSMSLLVRLEALSGLGAIAARGDAKADAKLLELLSVHEVLMRRAATEMVAGIVQTGAQRQSEVFMEPLLARQGDPDVVVRRSVVSCIAILSGRDASALDLLRPLEAAAGDADEHVRRSAVRSLGQMAEAGSESAAEAVMARARDDSNLVRAAVAESASALAKLGNDKATDLLQTLQADESFLVSEAAGGTPASSIVQASGPSRDRGQILRPLLGLRDPTMDAVHGRVNLPMLCPGELMSFAARGA